MIPCYRTILCNNYEQMNVLGDILNSGENIEYKEEYRFTVSFFLISPTIIDNYTKNKSMNI